MKNKKKELKRKTKSKKNWNKILLITLVILLVLEIVLIPCLVYAEVKKMLPIVFFLILPTLCGIVIILLSRNCTVDYAHKKERLIKKIQ